MVDGVGVPVRVCGKQVPGDAVVLAQPQRVHRQQAELLVGAVVARLEARHPTRLARVHLQTVTTITGGFTVQR